MLSRTSKAPGPCSDRLRSLVVIPGDSSLEWLLVMDLFWGEKLVLAFLFVLFFLPALLCASDKQPQSPVASAPCRQEGSADGCRR